MVNRIEDIGAGYSLKYINYDSIKEELIIVLRQKSYGRLRECAFFYQESNSFHIHHLQHNMLMDFIQRVKPFQPVGYGR